MADDLLSPLHAEHVALGAALTSFAGWQMPLRYTSDLAEHQAVRAAAGLFDLSHMGELEVTGPQAATALDHALVGDLTALAVGRARYTMLTAEDGSVLDDLVVYRLADQRFLVVANASNVEVVRDALTERISAFDAGLDDRSLSTALVAVQGPSAEKIVSSLTAPQDVDAVTGLKYYASVEATVAGLPALVARTGYTGEDGFELFVPSEDAPALWRALLEAGAPHGLVPAGLSARDSLRLEAGMPLYGNELDRTTTPYEAGLGRVVRLDKTLPDGEPLPFVGRAALAARKASPPARVLVGLASEGRRAARHGYDVLASTAPDSPVVGQVTSGAPSPTLGHPIAMAYVTPELSAEGTELAVDVRGRREPVRVVALPFYRRAR
ncbi:glycine cleavage system aminomethyltransferase GcvT [Cellulomonas cellasea]|uniref:glycine cleavage system aminomethyltransferase GcvT n=1 Tax=Cellulomonas cellasea TaxID=43670 RepID=UPI0025A3C134|nr:glycine cleavage system aminomethyltransferase GcvT [Cellulomonas cellasea]MDM8085052.1 glycine cleavage system aminomethyltransferase GcvT [Cellulomonas cellasea]